MVSRKQYFVIAIVEILSNLFIGEKERIQLINPRADKIVSTFQKRKKGDNPLDQNAHSPIQPGFGQRGSLAFGQKKEKEREKQNKNLSLCYAYAYIYAYVSMY